MTQTIQTILSKLASVDVLLKKINPEYPHGIAKEITQNILNKLKSMTVDNTISTLENSSSGFTEVFAESYNYFSDKDFIVK